MYVCMNVYMYVNHSQPKCYEVVLYTEDVQLLYLIDSFMRPVYLLPD